MVITTNAKRNICLISNGIIHDDVTMIINITTHSQYDKYQNNQNSSTTLEQMKANMNYKHSHNSLTNIHNPCMKNVLDIILIILSKSSKTHVYIEHH